MTDFQYDLLKTRLAEVGELRNLIPTRLPTHPEAISFQEIREDLEIIARHVDALVQAYGEYIASNSSYQVDEDMFRNRLGSDLCVGAFSEIEECEEVARQEAEDREPVRWVEERVT